MNDKFPYIARDKFGTLYLVIANDDLWNSADRVLAYSLSYDGTILRRILKSKICSINKPNWWKIEDFYDSYISSKMNK